MGTVMVHLVYLQYPANNNTHRALDFGLVERRPCRTITLQPDGYYIMPGTVPTSR